MSRKKSNPVSSHDDTGVSKEGTSTDDAVANNGSSTDDAGNTLSSTSQGDTGVMKGTSTDEACVNDGSSIDEPGNTISFGNGNLRMKPATIPIFTMLTQSLSVYHESMV